MSVLPRLLFLIGYRGSGKTTVARLLADRLGWAWLDADPLLEARHGQTIRQIFAAEGEAGFREKEAALLEELCGYQHHVIATGGGIILRPENRLRLKAAGKCIWLTAEPAVLWQRIHGDRTTAERRPDLTVGGLAEIEQLLAVRTPLYQECADLCVAAGDRTAAEVVDAILHWLGAGGLG